MTGRRRWSRATAALLTLALAIAAGCTEEPQGPTTADFQKEREAAKERAQLAQKAREQKAAQARTAPRPTASAAAAPTAGGDSGSAMATVGEGYVYDPTGKRDPFRNFKWERPDRLAIEPDAGPLEKFDLNQLEVVAVIWRTGNARALVMDPSGESHIIGEGAAIGKNQGHVVSIADNVVVVKETYVDYLGQETTKDIEMRMRRNEGG